jgi:hypothetical protein
MAVWQTTPLTAGSPGSCTFSYTISSLSASTIYEYRAYMVVDGNPYYGNILTGTTLALPTSSPTVCTGVAYGITTTSMGVCNNKVNNKGNLPVAEYGYLYTQVPAYGTSGTLIYGSASVCKKSSSADIATGTSYFTLSTNCMTSLAANTTTYFRAFAKNACGVGYGTVKTQATNPIPPTPVTVNLCTTSSTRGCVCFSPVLAVGQFIIVNFTTDHTVCTGVGGVSETQIYCKANGSPSFTQIFYDQTTTEQFCHSDGINGVQINYGDIVCFTNCSTAAAGSCSTICLKSITSDSPDITATLGLTTKSTVVI